MRNRSLIVYILVLLSTILIKAQDIDTVYSENFDFTPVLAGGQVELTTLLVVYEIGALLDFDLFKKISKIEYSFGARISFEHYSYLDFSSSKYEGLDGNYCFFVMHSGRSEKVHFNILAGLAYYPEVPTFTSANILFRVGFEFRFNPETKKIIGFIFKGATSFDSNTTYFGLGIAIGYYD